MSTTKDQFKSAAVAAIAAYPTAAQYYKAQDPRTLAMIDAMAAMLALKSADTEIASNEPFMKTRDVTVLADAAIKGVMPFGTPTTVKLAVANKSTASLTIATGRNLLDSTGRYYVVDSGATIAAGGTGSITATQRTVSTFTHTVTADMAFYTINIPAPDDGKSLVSVGMTNSLNQAFAYTEDFVNVSIGDLVFHLNIDEQRQLSILFGADNIAGFQPAIDDVFTVSMTLTEGYIELPVACPFALEYTSTTAERSAVITLDTVTVIGGDPMDVSALRDVCSFPSIYDSNAVFLGNFDFLIRRQISPFTFLSVWNEQTEESVRGVNEDNINCLFIAAKSPTIDLATLRTKMEAIINIADDSYRVKHVDVVDKLLPVSIVAYASSSYDFAVLKQQIIDVVIAKYGASSNFAKRGYGRIKYKTLYSQLTDAIPALAEKLADIEITVTDPVAAMLPEHFRYVSTASLTVNVLELQQ